MYFKTKNLEPHKLDQQMQELDSQKSVTCLPLGQEKIQQQQQQQQQKDVGYDGFLLLIANYKTEFEWLTLFDKISNNRPLLVSGSSL